MQTLTHTTHAHLLLQNCRRSLTMQSLHLTPSSSCRAIRSAPARAARFHTTSPRCLTTIARVTQVNQDQFEAEVLKSDKPVVVDFWADWCGPCKLVAPLMDWAEKEYKGAIKVVKVEHDANPKLIEEFKVYGLPALVLIKDGQLVAGSKREGAATKAIFVNWLTKHGITVPASSQ